MEARRRRIAAAAAGAALGVPAAFGAVPALGIVGGIAAALAVVAGGAASFMMMVPESLSEVTPHEKLHPDVRASLEAVFAACEGIRRSEIEAGVRHSAQSLLPIANDRNATVADMSFVILNMESLHGVAEAWKKTEASVGNPFSSDALATFTIDTIADITLNARRRQELLQRRAVEALQVELAVTRRITEDDSKGTDS